MASSAAKITVIGNPGRDPEMKYLERGTAITTFSLAVSHSKPDGQGGWKDEGTDWFDCTVWGERAERASEQIRKGQKVAVFGRFKSRKWTSEKTGKSGTALEITVDDWVLMSAKDQGEREDAPASGGAPAGSDDFSDLPF